MVRTRERQQIESEAGIVMSPIAGAADVAAGAGVEGREHDREQPPTFAIPPTRTGRI